MEEQEKQWAVELKKARQKTMSFASVPISIQRSRVAEQMSYEKNKLQQAMQERNSAEIDRSLDVLFNLRSEQTALNLAELQELYDTVDPHALEAEIKQYYADCHRLVRAVEGQS